MIENYHPIELASTETHRSSNNTGFGYIIGGLMYICRRCGSDRLRLSRHRSWRDALMKWLGFLPYRCRDCYRRCYRDVATDPKLRRQTESISESRRLSTTP
jgi:hypothetical protein